MHGQSLKNRNLDLALNLMRLAIEEQGQDFDKVYGVMGKERFGKSNLMLHMMDFLGAEIEDICLEGKDFFKRLYELPEGSAVALDEAGDSMFSRDAMTKETKNFVKAFQAIGGKKLIVFLVLPSIMRLDKYFREDRLNSFFLIHRRGGFIYYSPTMLKRVQSQGYIKLPPQKSRLRHSYPKYTGRLLEPYNKLKKKKIQDILRKMQPEEQVSERDKVIKNMSNQGFNGEQIGKAIGLTRSAVSKILKKLLNVEGQLLTSI